MYEKVRSRIRKSEALSNDQSEASSTSNRTVPNVVKQKRIKVSSRNEYSSGRIIRLHLLHSSSSQTKKNVNQQIRLEDEF